MLSWSSSITADAECPSPADIVTLTYSLCPVSVCMTFTSPEFTSSFALSTELPHRSWSTSSPYSDLPHTAPRAAAICRPTIPVPGMPTPMPFFSMLPLTSTATLKPELSLQAVPQHGHRSVSISAALAAASATAMGSVHPRAGFTSFFISSIISASRCVIV